VRGAVKRSTVPRADKGGRPAEGWRSRSGMAARPLSAGSRGAHAAVCLPRGGARGVEAGCPALPRASDPPHLDRSM
jgi:hypothetical protein